MHGEEKKKPKNVLKLKMALTELVSFADNIAFP